MSGLSDSIQSSVQLAKGQLSARFVRPLVTGAVIWSLVAIFGILAIVFLYVLADVYLAERLHDPIGAAAIIAGVNLLLVLILILARSATTRGR